MATPRATKRRRRRYSAEEWELLKPIRRVQRQRDKFPLPRTVGELYNENGKLRGEYIEHRPAEAALNKYHTASRRLIPEGVELTPGLLQAMKRPLVWNQIAARVAWAVMWVRIDDDGRRVKGRKNFSSLGAAIAFWGKIKPQISTATVVSLRASYDVPAELRGRIPRGWCWCPRCMVPRKYKVDESGDWFYAFKKVYSREKDKYEFKERPVAILRCPMCQTTNRDPAWRRSNQPWERRRVKRGVTRLKKKQRGHKIGVSGKSRREMKPRITR